MTQKGLSLLLLLSIVFAVGCGGDTEKGKSDANSKKEDQTAAKVDSNPRTLNNQEQKLVGVWLGQASLEDKLVEAEFETKVDDQAKIEFVDQAEVFLSTVMAIQFKADGTFEQDIEQTAAGVRQVGKGTWKVIGVEGSKLTLETKETDTDGNEVVAQRTFELSPNGKSFSISAPVGSSLAKCNPKLVFSIQNQFTDERTAEAPSQGGDSF